MRIIGKTSDGFMCEASKRELAQLQGYYYKDSNAKINIGDDFQINSMFEYLHTLAKDEKQMINSIYEIRKFLDKIEKVPLPVLALSAQIEVKIDKP